jgi:hypothetical protein
MYASETEWKAIHTFIDVCMLKNNYQIFEFFNKTNCTFNPANKKSFKTSTGEINVGSKAITVDETYSIGSQEFWCATGAPVSNAFMGAAAFPAQCVETGVGLQWVYTSAGGKFTCTIVLSPTLVLVDAKMLSFFACQ